MRDKAPTHTLGALLAAALAGAFAPGCSLGVEPALSVEEDVETPPLLEFETPLDGLVYGAADDEHPQQPGLDLRVRVRVRDVEHGVWLEDLVLMVRDEANGMPRMTAPVHDDWRGVRCAELPIALFPGEAPEHIVLEASAGEGLGIATSEIVVVGDG